MTYLVVSKPDRPLKYGKTTRLQYRVVLDNGNILRLSEVARQIKVPYPSLAARVHTELATVGVHEDAFLKIIADVRKRARKDKVKMRQCPHCHGSGKVPQSIEVIHDPS